MKNMKRFFILSLLTLLFSNSTFSQDWNGINTEYGRAVLGLNYLSSNTQFKVYNKGYTYGIYSVIPTKNNALSKTYSIYAKSFSFLAGDENWAFFSDGKAGFKGDVIFNSAAASSNNQWMVHLGTTAGSNRFTIYPLDSGVADSDNRFVLKRGGDLIKYVKEPDTTAIAVFHDGRNQFQVMGNGDLFARSIKVTLADFPDYVFESSYDLMPLEKLGLYVKENKHLPNIPSEKEIIENGLDVGEMQHKQMEKIEELTLYVIKLNEKINALEKELEVMKGK